MAHVPIYVKGGIWTNLEDQILKAAVQKYGTHAWNKVASLLQKKSSKQCQARWNEFLNPNLNFEPFSKEEDDKLLELAKRLPNQWRTVSDLMGRPAQTLIDRFSVLISVDQNDLTLTTGFEVGDIHPNNESIPAKPDAQTLLDEEREMLAEARARLLNTQGKKASRKIRERMLQESKRIALLQKRRELKQANVTSKIKTFKKKHPSQIDYNQDVIYEQEPPSGIYDTTEEDKRAIDILNRFEKTVNKKGLDGLNQSNSFIGKTFKRTNKMISTTVSGNNNTVTNENKKPKLNLVAPGHKSSSRSSQASILPLFDLLPPPLNDFEILPDEDETENEDQITVTDHTTSEITSERTQEVNPPQISSNTHIPANNSKVRYIPRAHLISGLTPPNLIQPTNSKEDEEFNRIVESKRDDNPIFESKELLDYITKINDDVASTLPEHQHHMTAKLLQSTDWNLEQKLSAAEFKVNNYRNDIETISSTRLDALSKLSNNFNTILKPKIIELQKNYYTAYLKYLHDSQTLQEKKSSLIDQLQFLSSS